MAEKERVIIEAQDAHVYILVAQEESWWSHLPPLNQTRLSAGENPDDIHELAVVSIISTKKKYRLSCKTLYGDQCFWSCILSHSTIELSRLSSDFLVNYSKH